MFTGLDRSGYQVIFFSYFSMQHMLWDKKCLTGALFLHENIYCGYSLEVRHYFSMKTYIVGTHKKCLTEALFLHENMWVLIRSASLRHYFSMKTYVVGTHRKCLTGALFLHENIYCGYS